VQGDEDYNNKRKSLGALMENQPQSLNPIDLYIAGFPPEVQEIMENVRRVIREEVPEVEEVIRYGMPTFRLNGNLVHFAAYKHHLGFYPSPSGITAFEDDLAEYKHAKGSVQFPLNRPIPYDLIRKIVQFRKHESIES